jgi:predicted dehydrogenase
MVEKPFTTDAAHARELVTEAGKRGVEIVVPYGWHYKPFIQEAKRRMDAGAVGKIEFVMCHMASPVRPLLEGKPFLSTGGGAGDVMFQPAADTWADPEKAGGGYALAQMSHSAGMAFFLTGLQAEEVSGFNSAPTSRVELYNAFNVKFRGGAIGTFSGAGDMPSDKGFQLDIRIFGTEGVLDIDLERARMEVQRHDGRHYKMVLPDGAGAYDCLGPPANFVDLVMGRTVTNWAPGGAGMRAIELIDAAYRSVKSGRPEKV